MESGIRCFVLCVWLSEHPEEVRTPDGVQCTWLVKKTVVVQITKAFLGGKMSFKRRNIYCLSDAFVLSCTQWYTSPYKNKLCQMCLEGVSCQK